MQLLASTVRAGGHERSTENGRAVGRVGQHGGAAEGAGRRVRCRTGCPRPGGGVRGAGQQPRRLRRRPDTVGHGRAHRREPGSQYPSGSATAPAAATGSQGDGVAALCRASTAAEFQLAVEDGSHLGPASLRYSADMWDALASSGPPELSADAAELAVQYRVLAESDDIDSAWARVGDTTTAAFRRVEAYADAHCESGQAK